MTSCDMLAPSTSQRKVMLDLRVIDLLTSDSQVCCLSKVQEWYLLAMKLPQGQAVILVVGEGGFLHGILTHKGFVPEPKIFKGGPLWD